MAENSGRKLQMSWHVMNGVCHLVSQTKLHPILLAHNNYNLRPTFMPFAKKLA